MFIYRNGLNLNISNFTGESDTDAILHCLLMETHLASVKDILQNNTSHVPKFRIVPLEGEEDVELDDDQARLLKEGMLIKDTFTLRKIYSEFKQEGRFGCLTKGLFDGFIFIIYHRYPNAEASNKLVIGVKLSNASIIHLTLYTGYREINAFKDKAWHRPFPNVAVMLKPDVDICFMRNNRLGLVIYEPQFSIDYHYVRWADRIAGESNAVLLRKTQEAITRLKRREVLGGIYDNLGTPENNFSSGPYFHEDLLDEFMTHIPTRYGEHTAANQAFNRNLDNFLNEYSSIAATAFQRIKREG